MDQFELFEKVTGRVSLKTGKILETTLKDACRETGAQYHEAADAVLISGTWEQVSETKRIINNIFEEKSGRTGSTSSSDYSEETSSGTVTFNNLPPLVKYIKTWHDADLKNIEQKYQVKFSWSHDFSKVSIKAQSNDEDAFKTACDQFKRMFDKLRQNISSIRYNITQNESDKQLESALIAVPGVVSGLILERSADGNAYTLWGEGQTISQAKLWICERLGVAVARKSQSPKGPPEGALTHETANQLKVVIYEGDITKENADIIVNACNDHLDHAGGVSFAISKAGGSLIQRESDEYVRKHGVLKAGDVAVTMPGLLRCKHIVHAVGPQWSKHGHDGCLKLFRTVFMNIYKAAMKRKATSIAIPAISSGLFGVPKDVCAEATFAFIDEVDQTLASDPAARPFEIRLVNIDDEMVGVLTRKFREWLFKGKKVERRHSITAITKEVKETPVEARSVDDTHKTPRLKASLVGARQPLQGSTKYAPSTTSKSTTSKSTTSKSTTSKSKLGSSATKENARSSYRSAPVTIVTVKSQRKNLNDPAFSTSQSNHSTGSITGRSPSSSKRDKASPTSVVRYNQNGSTSSSADNSGDCSICFTPFTDPVSLPKCGHKFCKPCIATAFTYQKKCPICQEVYGVLEGDQPDGTMEVGTSSRSLPGYEGCGCYVITYVIPDGRQGKRHPKPGHKFTGTKRRAYLPATKEGKTVLKMLMKAFDMKLIFTVGKSNTTGREDCVTWNDIHHKTSADGGPQHFGYPDPGYLDRVKDELIGKGIVPE